MEVPRTEDQEDVASRTTASSTGESARPDEIPSEVHIIASSSTTGEEASRMTDDDLLLKVVLQRLGEHAQQEAPARRETIKNPSIPGSSEDAEMRAPAIIQEKNAGTAMHLVDMVAKTPNKAPPAATPKMLQEPNWGIDNNAAASDLKGQDYCKAQLAILEDIEESFLQQGEFQGPNYSVIPGAYAVEGPGITDSIDIDEINEDATGDNENNDDADNGDEEDVPPRDPIVVSGTLILKRWTPRRICIAVFVTAGVLLGVVLATVIPLTINADNEALRKQQPVPPEPFRPIFSGLANATLEAIQNDPFSPAAIAYDWVKRDPFLDDFPEWKQRQRFALTAVYESLGIRGLGGDQNYNRHYYSDECDWQVGLSSACTPDGQVRVLRVHTGVGYYKADIGDGRLPQEIALLTNLEVIEFSGLSLQMPLVQFVPHPVPFSVQEFSCSKCKLEGPIPESFFVDKGMINLTKINLAENQLTGSIPQDLAELPSLVHFDVEANPSLGVFLPDGFCNLTEMTFLRTDWCENIPANCSTKQDTKTCCNHQKARVLCGEEAAGPTPWGF